MKDNEEKKASVRIPLYTRLLTRQERMECIGTGMMLKSASAGIPSGLAKEAALGSGLTGAADMGTKAVIALSLLTGVPLGIAGHLLHNSIKKKKLKEREALQKIDFYQDAADSVEDALAQQRFEM